MINGGKLLPQEQYTIEYIAHVVVDHLFIIFSYSKYPPCSIVNQLIYFAISSRLSSCLLPFRYTGKVMENVKLGNRRWNRRSVKTYRKTSHLAYPSFFRLQHIKVYTLDCIPVKYPTFLTSDNNLS